MSRGIIVSFFLYELESSTAAAVQLAYHIIWKQGPGKLWPDTGGIARG